MPIKTGAKVIIDGFDEETAEIGSGKKAIKVRSLRLPGKVKQYSETAPPNGDDVGSHPGNDPSPHYLVTLQDAEGETHDVWFCAPRVREA